MLTSTIRFSLICLLVLAIGMSVVLAEDAEMDYRPQMYERALVLLDEEAYDAAMAIFHMLENYKDSQANYLFCGTAKNEQIYQAAKSFMAFGQYSAAEQAFALVPDHRDSLIQAALCKSNLQQIQYDRAVALVEGNEYDEAQYIFNALGAFGSSAEQSARIDELRLAERYGEAQALHIAGNQATAMEIYRELGDYKDSADQVKMIDQSMCKEALLTAVAQAKALPLREAYSELMALKDSSREVLVLFDVSPIDEAVFSLIGDLIAELWQEDPQVAEAFIVALDDRETALSALAHVPDRLARVDIIALMADAHPRWTLQEETRSVYADAVDSALQKQDAASALSYLRHMESTWPDMASIPSARRMAYEQMAAQLYPSLGQALFMDVDADTVEDMVVTLPDSILFFALQAESIEAVYEPIVFSVSDITSEVSPVGKQYLLARDHQNGFIAVMLDAKGPQEMLRSPDVNEWILTETGICLREYFSTQPYRLRETEYVFTAEGASALPATLSFDTENYPQPASLRSFFTMYKEALSFGIPEEIALYETSDEMRAASASKEQFADWISSCDEVVTAGIYQADEEINVYRCAVSSTEKTAEALLYHDEDGSMPFQIIGLLDEKNLVAAHGDDFLPLDIPVDARLVYSDDYQNIHTYQLYVPESGGITFSFVHSLIDSGKDYYTLTLVPSGSDYVLWERSITGQKTETNYVEAIIDAGYYFLTVYPQRKASTDYSITAAFRPIANTESEPNSTYEAATPIDVNTLYTASFTMEKDVDMFKIKLDKPGKVQLHFEHEYFDNSKNHYVVSLLKGSNDDSVLLSRKYSGHDNDSTTYPFYLSAGEYYIRIKPDYYSSRPYAFSLLYTHMDNVESEFNGTFGNATAVPTNEKIYGAHSYEKDKDFYTFTLPEPGMVQLNFQHEYFDKGSAYYKLTLYDSATNDGALYSEKIEGRDSDFTRWRHYLDAGTYYFSVNPENWTSIPYHFTWTYTPMDNIEIERNNTYNTATPIAVNTTYSGSLIHSDDRDYYVFSLDSPSAVSIAFEFEYFDKSSNYFAIALDMTPNNANRYYSTKITGRENKSLSYEFYLPKGTYYVSVASDSSWTARPYTLLVNASPSESCELEWNNTYNEATPLQMTQTIRGSLRYDGDVDIYRLEVAQTERVRIYFEHSWLDTSSRSFAVHIDAQPNNSQRLLSVQVRGDESNAVSTDSVVLSPGTYYIVVERDSRYTPVPYMLTIG